MEEEKYKIIPLGINYPYTIEDISVVIPHASWYKNRLTWFLERYSKGTPTEVIKNTHFVCDIGDNDSFNEIEKYGMNIILNKEGNRDYSTLKMEVGFEKVKTRLCVRMHNDAMVKRSDWAKVLINQFNSTKVPQLIGQYHKSGDLGMEAVDKFMEDFLWYGSIKNKLEYYMPSETIRRIGCEYFHAYFMAGQTYIFRELYPKIVQFNNEKMDKEDCLFSQLVSSYNIQISAWMNLDKFISCESSQTSDFENMDTINKSMPIIVTNENRKEYPEPVWKVLGE